MKKIYRLLLLFMICSLFSSVFAKDEFKINDLKHGDKGMDYITIDSNQNIYVSNAVKNCIVMLGKINK